MALDSDEQSYILLSGPLHQLNSKVNQRLVKKSNRLSKNPEEYENENDHKWNRVGNR